MNKDLKYYKDLKYRMIVEYFPEDQAYFVKFPELPGCIADGSTPEEAVNKALKIKDEWLQIALETGWTIPEPTAPFKTSGRITVRAPKTLHDRLIDLAQQEGISLNTLILNYLAQGAERSNVELRVVNELKELTDKVNTIYRNTFERKNVFAREPIWPRKSHVQPLRIEDPCSPEMPYALELASLLDESQERADRCELLGGK